MRVGNSRRQRYPVCTGMRRNVSDAFSVMNVLRIDVCAGRAKREVQFSEALMFKGYQCRGGKGAPQRVLSESRHHAHVITFSGWGKSWPPTSPT